MRCVFATVDSSCNTAKKNNHYFHRQKTHTHKQTNRWFFVAILTVMVISSLYRLILWGLQQYTQLQCVRARVYFFVAIDILAYWNTSNQRILLSRCATFSIMNLLCLFRKVVLNEVFLFCVFGQRSLFGYGGSIAAYPLHKKWERKKQSIFVFATISFFFLQTTFDVCK